MDTKSLAKSKRAHSLHHKKHQPNQKVKGSTSSVSTSGRNMAVKGKPGASRGLHVLPSNSDRYEDEDDPMTESQTDGQLSQPKDVVRKSKGADYVYLISEAKSQISTRLPSEIFPSLDDFVSDFGQGKDSFFDVRGESLLSSIQNDCFFVDDKTPANYEASFLSLNMHALADQLAKIDLPKRLFMEADLFSLEQHSKKGQERQDVGYDHDDANTNKLQQDHHDFKSSSTTTTKSHHQAIQDHTSGINVNPMVHPTPNSKPNSDENRSKLKPETAEAELDMLMDSFAETNHHDLHSSASATNTTTTTKSHLQAIQDHTSSTSMNPMMHPTPNLNPNSSENISKLKSETAEAELDMLLDSFADANLKEKPTTSTSKKNIVAFDIDSTLDDLLKETSTPSHEVNSTLGSVPAPSQPVSKSVLLDDFDSWLDTI